MNHDNVVIIWHVDKACHIGGASDGRGTERDPETEDPCGAPKDPGLAHLGPRGTRPSIGAVGQGVPACRERQSTTDICWRHVLDGMLRDEGGGCKSRAIGQWGIGLVQPSCNCILGLECGRSRRKTSG